MIIKKFIKLLSNSNKRDDNRQELKEIILSAIELLSLERNDLSWSGWESQNEAIDEFRVILELVERKQIPPRLNVSILFAPTGPLQEVSISSGWSDTYLKLAERFDKVEKQIWQLKFIFEG